MPAKLTERTVQRMVFYDITPQAVIVPNFAPGQWFECDIWSLTKAGYQHEYEIKLSAADFYKDKKKVRDWQERVGPGRYDWEHRQATKHSLLAAGDHARGAPSRFTFVVPETLFQKITIPDWAGVSVVYRWDYGPRLDSTYGPRWDIKRVRVAPLLHKIKVTDAIRQQASSSLYHRYWDTRRQLDDLKADPGVLNND